VFGGIEVGSGEQKLQRGMIDPEHRLTLDEWIAPFATAQNRYREVMIADLISAPLEGKAFSFHQTDPATGKQTVQRVEADAGEKLKAAIEGALATHALRARSVRVRCVAGAWRNRGRSGSGIWCRGYRVRMR